MHSLLYELSKRNLTAPQTGIHNQIHLHHCFIDAKPQELTQDCARAQGSVPKWLRAGSGPCKFCCMYGFNAATARAQGDCYDRGIAGLGPKIIKYIKIFVLSTTEAQFLKMNGTKNFCICEIKMNYLDKQAGPAFFRTSSLKSIGCFPFFVLLGIFLEFVLQLFCGGFLQTELLE